MIVTASLIGAGLILALSSLMNSERIRDARSNLDWIASEHEHLRVAHEELKADFDMFIAGRLTLAEKPERTPGMP